ncbi:TBC1 domain family member 13 isoform X4 [Vigna radiata var. radiata]|uniref:TBC1 domain family member 13 isoform X4 n=1 Tax=Vigna radiata var. radiata TaxID=3916 RepID=A0A3Q0EXV2_VIGRR|nr:TBC1 domain family member 13 isoform X4 [Vigna radiata var. radiata]
MVKKVPDWLNSSLWSSSQSSSPPSAAASPFQQPSRPLRPAAAIPSEPPPPPVVQDPPPTQIIEDSPIEDHGDVFPSAYDVTRQAQLLAELSKKVVDMSELRSRACQGIPDAAGIRSTVWKLLLGYLPPDRGLWSSELAKKRSQYKQFKEEILMNPSEITRKMYNPTICDTDDADCGRVLLSRSEITHGEHPLSLGKTSVWNQFFQDTEIIDQIDRDVKRTHPDMHFFCGDSQFAKSNQEALKNVLIIFAKLNPGVRYVQGMNELLAPLFYVFKNDPDEENAAFAEADAFFCFVELLSGLRDNFVQQLDNSVVGIRSTITRLSQLLREHDEELWRHLEVTSKETLLRVCCAMLVLVRKRLLAGDFTSNLKLLQNYPTTNISHLLYVANKFRVQSV